MDGIIFFSIASVLILAYLYYNGSNDAPNSIATLIATGVMRYRYAVVWSGILNAVGPFATTAVAKTIAKGIVSPEFITQNIVLGGLVGAVVWAGFATWKGIPVSITHSLIGGIMGAGIAAGGFGILNWHTLYFKIFLAIAIAPIAGFALGFTILCALKWLTFRIPMSRYKANSFWRTGQLLSGSWLSFSHGMNDGQNGVGILVLAFFVAGFSQTIEIQWWMILVSGVVIGLGTIIGGGRVIKKVGWQITDLEPIDGFSAQIAAAGVNSFASFLGIPSSTTHVSVSGVFGTGCAKSFRSIDKSVARQILIAWILSIPSAAIVGGITHAILLFFNPS